MINRLKSTILTLIQFISMIGMLYSQPWAAPHATLIALQVSGIMLGMWAVVTMSRGRLNITPLPPKGIILITDGPYRWIRHPMYTGLALIFFPMILSRLELFSLSVLLIFSVNMALKLTFEEQLLMDRFERYQAYREKTWRLLPWVY